MKKTFRQVFIMLISIFVIMSPMIVKADLLQLHSDAYSKYVSVGSEFIYVIEVGNNSFNGTVTFDNTILEVSKVETIYSGSKDVYSGAKGTVSQNVSGNQLSINYVTGDLEENILVTFKVKAYPSNGTTTVKVKSNNNMWFGEPSNTMTVIKAKECPTCPTCEKDETSCPVCEECEKCETNNELGTDNNNNNDDVNNNTLLYVSLGACGILALAVIILAFRKK